MSLTTSLYTTSASLKNISAQMSTVSSNVTNADKAGYTTKTYETSYITGNGVTSPSGGITVGSISSSLYSAAISDYSESAFYGKIEEYLSLYSSATGSTDSSSSISSTLNSLQSALEQLAASPEENSVKTEVVNAAITFTDSLNSMSDTLQTYRQQADQEIATVVNDINDTLETLKTLNDSISTLSAQGASTADLEDERMAKLLELSEMTDVNYYFTSNNELRIYTSSGQTLLDSQAHTISFDATYTVNDQTTYPGSLSGIYLNGQDITESLSGGTLGGLIQIRDVYLVEEQEKLDELASTVAEAINSVSNSGTAYPARSILTAETLIANTSDALNATGTVRIAVVDATGTVQSYADLDLSTYSTYDDLAAAIEGISGISASFNSDGALVISADNTDMGIAINEMDSSINGQGFSASFGFNNLLSGTTAASLSVSDYLQDNADYLSTSYLSADSALSVGDAGTLVGDGTTATALSSVLDNNTSFSAAGNFGARTTDILTYAGQIVSDIAVRASTAESNSDVAISVYNQTKDLLDNSQGVNIDEETIRLTTLENQYQAAATLLQTVQDMFDSLLDAVN